MEIVTPNRKWIDDTKVAVRSAADTADFVNDHQLWQGFFQYKWVAKGLSVMGVLMGLYFVVSLLDFSTDPQALDQAGFSFGDIFSWEWLSSLSGSGGNFLILIASEIIIFHFVRRTMMTVTGTPIDTSFKTFIGAEKRMIKVAIFAFIMEVLTKALASVAIGISDFDFLDEPVSMMLHSFYLGFAVIDNYNELFGMNLTQSHRFSWHYAPICLIVGGILAIILNIPFFGPIIGPVICAVVGTLAMHEVVQRDQEISWVFVEKKKKKKRK